MREDTNETYDRRRCRCCGVPWPEHDMIWLCNRYRPAAAPPRAVGEPEPLRNGTASNLAPSVDQAEVARREVEGGEPTREWTVPHPSIPVKVTVRAVGEPWPTDPRVQALMLIAALEGWDDAPLRVLQGPLKAAIIARANDLANGHRAGAGAMEGELRS